MPPPKTAATSTLAPAGFPGARIYAGYLALQAFLGVVQWVLVAVSPTVRGGYEILGSHRAVTNAFAVADIVTIVASALSAWALAKDRPWAVPMLAFTLGAVFYPTVYLLGWMAFSGDAPTVALAEMVVVSTLTGWITYQTWRASRR